MRTKSILAALLLVVAGVQTAWGQGFRVYKSDGTVTQFSLRTDSIVFYDGIGSDQDFGPFTPVNSLIEGKWYKSHSEAVTFVADGTTDYIFGGTYEFLPYQGEALVYNASKQLKRILRIHKVTKEELVVSSLGATGFSVWTKSQPVQLVTGITLSAASLTLQLNETATLTATVLPDDANNKAVTWKSSDEAVAVVGEAFGTIMVMAKGYGSCTITCTAQDGSGVKATCAVTVAAPGPQPDEHEWVDLGLPSGTKWATCNVGASSPEEYGDYFAWGETQPKTTYNWSTYKWMNAGQSSWSQINKYTYADGQTSACWYDGNGNFIGDGLTELEAADDVATVNWGNDWQMPNVNQMEELVNNSYTTTEWMTLDGIDGRKITSKSNGNSIFLPAAGYRDNTGLGSAGSYGYYWSRSLCTYDSYYACSLNFYSGRVGWYYYDRGYGRSVRPVRVK